jgi:hypothetical protein
MNGCANIMEVTKHWANQHKRIEFINENIGMGNPVSTFRWDKGHPNGPELHTITDTGIIIIKNEITDKLITALIARPNQIYRYYINNNEEPPEYLISIAKEHTHNGYNYK